MYLLGVLSGVGLFVLVSVSVYLGYTIGQKKKPKPEPIDEQEKERQKRFNEHFQALFNYNEDIAYGRKVSK
jgi:hypothetical protein